MAQRQQSKFGQGDNITAKIQQLKGLNDRFERMLNNSDIHKYSANIDDLRFKAKNLSEEIVNAMHNHTKNENQSYAANVSKELKRFASLSEELIKRTGVATNYDNTSSNSRANNNNNNGKSTFEDDMKQSLLLRPTVAEDEVMDVDQLRARQEQIESVQKDVNAIHGMFQDVHLMVLEQGEQLDLIEANLTTTLEQSTDAHQQLTEAEDYQRRSRRSKCCLMLIVAVVAGALAIGLWQVIS